MKYCNKISSPTPQSEHEVENHYMIVNSNPIASQQNRKKKFIYHLYFRISPLIFEKKEMTPMVGLLRDTGEIQKKL
jgi:hypothetical protein